jgi:F-type H+-transporting ATPase subunit delta
MNAGEASVRLGDIYARALLDLAAEPAVADAVREDMASIRQFLKENPELVAVMGSPRFSQSYKTELLERLFAGRVNELTLDFLLVAADHNRLMFLPQMISAYMEKHDARCGLQTVRVTVSEPASIQTLNELCPRLAEILKSRVKLDVAVDPSILGGLILRCGDKVIDNSVRTRLNRAIAAIMKRQDTQG